MKTLPILLTLICLAGCDEYSPMNEYADGEYPFELRENPSESQQKALHRRDLSSIHHDEAITYKAMKRLSRLNKNGSRVKITVLNGHVLVTGAVNSKHTQNTINSLLNSIDGVYKISNNTRVSSTNKSQRKSDQWVKTKVRANLIKEKSLNSSNIKISSENGTIYLMGTGSSADREKANDAAKNVDGVQDVVNLMEPS
jgi:osmotically-inducible protein OsmY